MLEPDSRGTGKGLTIEGIFDFLGTLVSEVQLGPAPSHDSIEAWLGFPNKTHDNRTLRFGIRLNSIPARFSSPQNPNGRSQIPVRPSRDTRSATSDGVIISPDTHRSACSTGASTRTRKWPVLHYSSVPHVSLDRWQFSIFGLVETPLTFNWEEFQALPRVKVFADSHCVTRWSRLGNVWEGVSVSRTLVPCRSRSPKRSMSRRWDTITAGRRIFR